jgi:hypothetical protein
MIKTLSVRRARLSWAYWTGSGRATVKASLGAGKVQKATGETASTRPGRRIPVTPVPVWMKH